MGWGSLLHLSTPFCRPSQALSGLQINFSRITIRVIGGGSELCPPTEDSDVSPYAILACADLFYLVNLWHGWIVNPLARCPSLLSSWWFANAASNISLPLSRLSASLENWDTVGVFVTLLAVTLFVLLGCWPFQSQSTDTTPRESMCAAWVPPPFGTVCALQTIFFVQCGNMTRFHRGVPTQTSRD